MLVKTLFALLGICFIYSAASLNIYTYAVRAISVKMSLVLDLLWGGDIVRLNLGAIADSECK